MERDVFRFRFKKLDMFVLIIEYHDKNTYAFIIRTDPLPKIDSAWDLPPSVTFVSQMLSSYNELFRCENTFF